MLLESWSIEAMLERSRSEIGYAFARRIVWLFSNRKEPKMAIRSYVENGEKLYRVYINGFSPRGDRFQKKRKGIKILRAAETAEFEFKRELAKLREENVQARWGEWFEECLTPKVP